MYSTEVMSNANKRKRKHLKNIVTGTIRISFNQTAIVDFG